MVLLPTPIQPTHYFLQKDFVVSRPNGGYDIRRAGSIIIRDVDPNFWEFPMNVLGSEPPPIRSLRAYTIVSSDSYLCGESFIPTETPDIYLDSDESLIHIPRDKITDKPSSLWQHQTVRLAHNFNDYTTDDLFEFLHITDSGMCVVVKISNGELCYLPRTHFDEFSMLMLVEDISVGDFHLNAGAFVKYVSETSHTVTVRYGGSITFTREKYLFDGF